MVTNLIFIRYINWHDTFSSYLVIIKRLKIYSVILLPAISYSEIIRNLDKNLYSKIFTAVLFSYNKWDITQYVTV